ncbi:5-oxoprolinase subunit PxpA [Lachnospiraceae bacterium 54-53]
MYQIDLNSDMGESFGAYKIGNDEEIIKYVTSANIACGWHGGDPMVMDQVTKAAKERKVAIGAHPGYPDLMGFGRRSMVLKPMEIKNYVKYQIGALSGFTAGCKMKIQHVAPHGALGNLCQYDREASRAVCEAVYETDPGMIIFYCAGAVLGEEAEKMGLKAASEIFADRAYMDDLSLVPRSMAGAMITDENAAVDRCIRMIKEGRVTSVSGKELEIKGDTLCVHGDGLKALAFVMRLREAFTNEGIAVNNFQE